MHYILKGKPSTVKKILQENAVRVHRGEVQFIPMTETSCNVLVADDKYVNEPHDNKHPEMPIDQKVPKPRKKKE